MLFRTERLVPRSLAVACIIASAVTGCSSAPSGPKTYPVSGTVTFAGLPVEQGKILFRHLAGDERGYSAEIVAGAYEAEVEAGPMRVEITASRVVPGKFTEVNPGEKDPVYEMYIPKQYNAKSVLEIEVAPEKNEHSFELKAD